MKKIKTIVTLAFLQLFFLTATAQTKPNVTKDANGNFIALTTAKKASKAKDTGKTYTHTDGKVYPVFVSVNGKYFVKLISKAGNEYPKYLNE